MTMVQGLEGRRSRGPNGGIEDVQTLRTQVGTLRNRCGERHANWEQRNAA